MFSHKWTEFRLVGPDRLTAILIIVTQNVIHLTATNLADA